MAEVKRKYNFRLAESTVEVLRSIAEERGITLTEALRQAIGTEDYLRKATKKGSKVLIQDKSATRELVFK